MDLALGRKVGVAAIAFKAHGGLDDCAPDDGGILLFAR